MNDIDRVLIWGAGAMGTLYASKLYTYDSNSVYLFAGASRYEILIEKGLTINGQTFFPRVVSPEEKSRPFDLVIVSLKHHQLLESLLELQCAVTTNTVIMSVMNGIDSEEILGQTYGNEKVLPTVAVGMDALRETGQVTYTNEGRLIFGKAETFANEEKIQRVKRFFDKTGISFEITSDIVRALWWKLMINVGVNQTSAVLKAPFGVFQSSKDARMLMEKAMSEVIAVAKAMNVNLVENDLNQWYPILYGLSPSGKTSMLQDVEAGRKTEVEVFAGKIVALGKQYDIPTPVNDTLLSIIKVYEHMRNLSAKTK
jgi:2-dehydropantoate 2-reductase